MGMIFLVALNDTLLLYLIIYNLSASIDNLSKLPIAFWMEIDLDLMVYTFI